MRRALYLIVLLAGCVSAPLTPADPAQALAAELVQAHGGMQPWNRLSAMKLERVHVFEPGRTRRFEFTIDGDLHGPRMEQEWRQPAGRLSWDGVRAEAGDWPLARQLLPQFTMSIGFYLVNMPWLVNQPGARIERLPPAADLLPADSTEYARLAFTYKAPMIDDGSDWSGDLFVLYIDQQTHRLRAVKQHRRWPPQMRAFGLPEGEEFFQTYVVDTEVTQAGITLPDEYRVFDVKDELVASGRMGPYTLR